VAALAVGLSFLFPWLAELEVRRAVRTWQDNPAQAFRQLDRARALNPLSARADLLAGAIASRKDEPRRMAQSFARAVDRNPDNWYARFELGIAHAALGQRAASLAELSRAARLNPRETAIQTVRGDVLAGRRIDRNRIDQLFVERVRSRVGP
jgi:tetratricopeptide (TPR) repeat protein